MKFSFEVKKTGMLLENMPRAIETFSRELRISLEKVGNIVLNDTLGGTPVGATSALKQGTQLDAIRGRGLNLATRVGTPVQHALPVEFGQKPHMPPVDPLVFWARRKLGISADEAIRVAHKVALKIRAVGTKGVFMFLNAYNRMTPKFMGYIDSAFKSFKSKVNG